MNEIVKQLGEFGLVPVVKIENAADAVNLANALIQGGLPVAEVTFRTAAAEEAIKRINDNCPDILLGAGTVLTVDQVKKAVAAGARYIVSPGFNPKVVDYCVENEIPITPGINNPTGIEAALERGLEVLKFFPAEASGGLKMLKAMAAPYGDVKFMPTGGVNAKNLAEYLAFDKIHACGGSWMVPAKLISDQKFDEIARLTKEAVATLHGFEFAHLGINSDSEEAAWNTVNMFAENLFLPTDDRGGAVYTGPTIEVIKKKFVGEHGHIGFYCNSVARAIAYFKRQGLELNTEGYHEENGVPVRAFLKQEVAGFAVHVIQR